jgi:hypothetical protein
MPSVDAARRVDLATPREPRKARLRRLQTERTRRLRARIGKGLACVTGEVSGLGLDWLVALGYLQDADAGNREAVGVAVSRLIEVSALAWRQDRGL